jgi:hypothetical protein
MKTKHHQRAVRILVIRLCLSLGIFGIGFLYPVLMLHYDLDISTPEGQVDFRAAGVPPFALLIALGYALRAGCRFYCTSQDLRYEAENKVREVRHQ